MGSPKKLPWFILALAWRSYLRKLQEDPLLVKSLTSALLSVCSEVFAKRVKNLPVRSSTALNEFTIGLILRVVFKGAKQSSPSVVIGKLAIDQLLFAPVFTSLYFYLQGFTEDRSIATTSAKLKSELPSIMKTNWSVWVPANFINYLVVPLELRVLFGSVIGLFWNAYLISQASRVTR